MMKVRAFVQFIPLSIIIGTIAYSTFLVCSSNIAFQEKHHLGHLFAIACFCFAILKKKYEPLATGFMLFAGTLSLIAFTPTILTFHLNSISIQPFSLLILIIHVVLNRGLIRVATTDIFS
jgi:hypothetical protein